MLRQIIIPKETHITLNLPKEYIGKEIEILVFPIPSEMDTIATSEMDTIATSEMDTTEYLLSNPANARRLLTSLENARSGKVFAKDLIDA
jgi:hypothetical protein